MKKLFAWLLTAALVLSLGTVSAFAEEISEEPVTREPGYCGENIKWTYADGVLTLEGSGRTDDFYAGQPWQQYRGELKEVKLSGDITYLGAYAFPDYDALEKVDFGSSLTEIGQGAFSGSDRLTSVSLPMSFRIFGEESFSHCKNLKEFHFEGGFPKFKLNCLWDTWAKLYFPAERPWPLEHIMQLEEAFQGRIEFLASDGSDPYVPQQETEPEETTAPATEVTTEPSEETAPVTEATLPPTEAPETKPPVIPTEAPTEAPTEVETIPPTTEEYVELPEPEEDDQDEDSGLSLPMAGLIALMVLSGGGALFLIGRMSGNKRKDFAGDFSEILLEDEKKRKKPTTAQKTASKSRSRKSGKYSK